jgi:hypothetical protein
LRYERDSGEARNNPKRISLLKRRPEEWVQAIGGLIAVLALPAILNGAEARTPPGFGGPEAVSQQLKASETEESTQWLRRAEQWAQPWHDWKARVRDRDGLSFGLYAYLLYQGASETGGHEDDAFGGVYRFMGSWTVLGRGTKDPGRVEFRVENSSRIGGGLAPAKLSGKAGVAALNTGFGYSHNFDTDLAVLNWTQGFADGRVGIALDSHSTPTWTRLHFRPFREDSSIAGSSSIQRWERPE